MFDPGGSPHNYCKLCDLFGTHLTIPVHRKDHPDRDATLLPFPATARVAAGQTSWCPERARFPRSLRNLPAMSKEMVKQWPDDRPESKGNAKCEARHISFRQPFGAPVPTAVTAEPAPVGTVGARPREEA